jgi:hypothetical protein
VHAGLIVEKMCQNRRVHNSSWQGKSFKFFAINKNKYGNILLNHQVEAVQIFFDKTITLCSAYIPPNSSIILTQLKHPTDHTRKR